MLLPAPGIALSRLVARLPFFVTEYGRRPGETGS